MVFHIVPYLYTYIYIYISLFVYPDVLILYEYPYVDIFTVKIAKLKYTLYVLYSYTMYS